VSRAPARRRLVVFEHLTLDGVMQAPGRADEDRRDGFERGEAQLGSDRVVLGSRHLAQTLMRHGLVDEYVLLIHPLVRGSGRRLFDTGARAALRLVDATSPSGVVIASHPSGAEDG
jgi:dihydrofolate reductase